VNSEAARKKLLETYPSGVNLIGWLSMESSGKKLCLEWFWSGECSKGRRCRFAHEGDTFCDFRNIESKGTNGEFRQMETLNSKPLTDIEAKDFKKICFITMNHEAVYDAANPELFNKWYSCFSFVTDEKETELGTVPEEDSLLVVNTMTSLEISGESASMVKAFKLSSVGFERVMSYLDNASLGALLATNSEIKAVALRCPGPELRERRKRGLEIVNRKSKEEKRKKRSFSNKSVSSSKKDAFARGTALGRT